VYVWVYWRYLPIKKDNEYNTLTRIFNPSTANEIKGLWFRLRPLFFSASSLNAGFGKDHLIF